MSGLTSEESSEERPEGARAPRRDGAKALSLARGTGWSTGIRAVRVAIWAALSTLPLPQALTAGERELEQQSAPASVEEIASPIQRVFASWTGEEILPTLFPALGERLAKLPPFLADTRFSIRFRTYYLRKQRESDALSEAWAIGGSLYYRSGWLADTFAAEVEGFASQPLWAPADHGGTGLLTLDQQGYNALGIANARLRHRGIELIGYRQYLDLPYVNREDNRMTPNTFEALVLAKHDGDLRFNTGYVWKIKRQTSEKFVSMSEALGLSEERGLAFGGVFWEPSPMFDLGAVAVVVPDILAGAYFEAGVIRTIRGDLDARLDTQISYEAPIGDQLLGSELSETWNLGLRGSASWRGLVVRLGGSFTGSGGPILKAYGSSPSYLNLMQRVFDRANEKALLASASYDFSPFGFDTVSFIANFGAGFGGEFEGRRGDVIEIDGTLDYKLTRGPLRGLWLRVRGSWLHDDLADRDGTDVRVVLRYDLGVL